MALIIFLFFLSFSYALEIFSKQLEIVSDKVIAEGEVETTYKDYYIKADRVELNTKTEEVKAFGNVYIKSLKADLEVWGEFAYIDTRKDKGYFLNAEGKFREFNFEARKIKQVEKGKYKVYDAVITTCPLDDKELYLCIKKAEINSERAFIFNNTLRFFKIPIFYLPFYSVPLGGRKSGLLFPTLGFTKYSSFIYRQPLFVVLGRDRDITLTSDYRRDQMKGLEIEYRQVFTKRDNLDFKISLYKEDNRGSWWNGRGMYRENRYSFFFKLKKGNFKLQLEELSDPYFYEDISFKANEQTKPFTLNYISYEKMTPLYSFFSSIRAYKDLTREDNEETIFLLPEVFFETSPINLWGLNLSLTTGYTNFYSEKSGTQNRFIFNPEISKFFRVWKINNFSSLTLRNQLYPNDSKDRELFTYTFRHAVPQNFYVRFKGFNFSNLLELTYSFTPEGFKGEKFDTYDQITEENNFTLKWVGNLYRGRTFLDFYLETGYNLLSSYLFPTDEVEINKRLLPLSFRLNFYPLENLSIWQDGVYDVNLGIFARNIIGLSLDLSNWSFSVSNVSFRDSKGDRTSDQITFGITYSGERLLSGISFNYDRLAKKQTYANFVLGVKGKCWQIKLDLKRRYFRNRDQYVNEGTISFNLFFLETIELPILR